MSTISGIGTSGSTTLRQLVASYLALEREPLNMLQTIRSNLTMRAACFTDLKTKLTALRSSVDDLALPAGSNPLLQFQATVSHTSVLSVAVTSGAETGTHALTVDVIAKAHSLAGSELVGSDHFSGSSGTYTFTLEQGGETHEITVEIGEGLTNAEVLAEVAQRIDASSADVNATVVTTDSATGEQRLVITSTESGTANLISAITDTSGDLASVLGIAGSSTAEAYSSNTVQQAADAAFNVDGLSLTSSSNTVTGVLPGVTLTLLSVSEASVTINVARDTESIQESLQTILDKYNEVIDYVLERTKGANAEGENRGEFTGNATFMSLRRSLRTLAANPVESIVEEGALTRLSEIGITIDSSGHLTISDDDAFEEALTSRPEEVEQLFRADDGIANRIVDDLARYTRVNGLITNESNAIQSRQRALDLSIKRMEERLARRETQMLTQLTYLQSMVESLSGLQTMLNNINSGNNSNN
jgi:flagellar hook-associated protein 2